MKTLNRVSGPSQYFRGDYRIYGRYQWNIKYYGWQNDSEIEAAQCWAFEDIGQFLEEKTGQQISWGIEGRSGGWFVVYNELSKVAFDIIDQHINEMMNHLPEFLKMEREYNQTEEE